MKRRYHVVSNVIIASMLICLTLFTINVNSDYVFNYNHPDVIYEGDTSSDKVSLMINVYWGNEYIEPILKVLDDYQVKCTFFVGGSWASKYPDMLKKIYEKGHEIGNHGYFHKDQDKLSYDQNYDEINMCHKVVKQLIGLDMTLFAPPSGAYNKNTVDVATSLGYHTIMWSLDTIDWRDHDADIIFKRATEKAKGGSLILSHPTAETLEALPKILQYYKDHGLKQCTVSQNIKGE